VQNDFSQYLNLYDCITRRGDKLYFDPIKFARDRLFIRGLKPENLYDVGICTVCGGKDLFSFRRNKTYHRTINFIINGTAF
jgi:copper oxidase (laccase) domain-containing protein